MTDFLTHQEQLTIDLKQALQLARRYPDNQNLLDFCSHLQNQLDTYQTLDTQGVSND